MKTSIATAILLSSVLVHSYASATTITGLLPDTTIVGKEPEWHVKGTTPGGDVYMNLVHNGQSVYFLWEISNDGVVQPQYAGDVTFHLDTCGYSVCPWKQDDAGSWIVTVYSGSDSAGTSFSVTQDISHVPAVPTAPLAAFGACLGAIGIFLTRKKLST